MVYKIVLVCLLVMVLWNLFYGLSSMISPKSSDREAMVRALSFRIALSLLAFFMLLLGWSQGWWYPHAI